MKRGVCVRVQPALSVSLKELPDGTFPGVLRELVSLNFPIVVSAEVSVPDQTKVIGYYKGRLRRMTSAQKDISNVGNREVIDMAVRAGCWLRSDSVIVEEPEQIEELANRPQWLAAIMEDGYYRRYDASTWGPMLENTMLQVLDLGANY